MCTGPSRSGRRGCHELSHGSLLCSISCFSMPRRQRWSIIPIPTAIFPPHRPGTVFRGALLHTYGIRQFLEAIEASTIPPIRGGPHGIGEKLSQPYRKAGPASYCCNDDCLGSVSITVIRSREKERRILVAGQLQTTK